MAEQKSILFISGGIEAVPAIQTAKKMGLHVVVADANTSAPGFDFADGKIVASTYDVDSVLNQVLRYHREVHRINGVICVAADVPLTTAVVAERLELRGIPVNAAKLATDKIAMKNQFSCDRVPIPWYSEVKDLKHLHELVAARNLLVLKPADSRGARGVLRLLPSVDLKWAYEFSKKYSPTSRVLVEEFLDGPQVSTESLVLDGKAYTPGFSDRNYEFLEKYSPHIIENGGDLPSVLSRELQEKVFQVVEKAAASLGIRNGVVKGDIVVHKGEAYVIELAARLSGGYFCTHQIPLSTGVDFVKQAILWFLGEAISPEDLSPRFQKNVCQRFLFPNPGKVFQASGLEQALKAPGVELAELRVKPGDVVGPVDSHPARAGVVIVTGASREDAQMKANFALSCFRVSG